MKLKLDENGHVVVRNGKPVYVYDDGKEVEADVPELFTKIRTLNDESKGHRLKAKEAEEKLAKFGEVDPDELASFLDEVEALGGMEEIRKGTKVDVNQIKTEMTKVYEEKLSAKDKVISEKDSHIYKLEVSNRFKASPLMDQLVLTPDIAEAAFAQNFKIEEGTVVGYLNGQRIFSREKPGELANFDESLAAIIEAHPQKDRILKGSNASGSGTEKGGPGTNGTVKSRADLKSDADKAAFIGENGLQAWKDLPATA